MNWKRLRTILFFLVVSVPLLGSSVTFCDTGDIYNKAYDQSHEYSSRWSGGVAQLTPHWTPDGSHIVFGHAGRIYVVDADGSNLQSLSGSFEPASPFSQTAEIDFSPSLSPDGARVAYATLRYARGELREHTYEIATQAINGSDRRRLTSNDWNDVSPAWSPDGSRIAFVSSRTEGPRVFTIASDGSDEQNVAPSVQAQTNAPVWSPDGSRLAFVAWEGEDTDVQWMDTYEATPTLKTTRLTIHREAVYTVRADGSDLRKLAWSDAQNGTTLTRYGGTDISSPEEDIITFQWSPDGKRMAFVARYYGEPDRIFVASPDGSEVEQIFDLSTIGESEIGSPRWVHGIAWSSDDSQISFEVEHGGTWTDLRGLVHTVIGVYTIAADGSELRTVIDYRDRDTYIGWPDRLVGTGPGRIVRYSEGKLNVAPEFKGWILSTITWDGSDERVLVKLSGDYRLVAANP